MTINVQGVGMTSQRTRSRLVDRLREQGIGNEKILSIISATPRHAFLDEALAHRAYEEISLPIGFGQTLSQPYVVARMTEALFAQGGVQKVLEIGTGSGYQTAVLAQLAGSVYTLERILPLQARAQRRLAALGYTNIHYKHEDGRLGWAAEAPFDAVLVTAAAATVPEELLAQLGEGGSMLAPVGDGNHQELRLFQRRAGQVLCKSLGPVKFVPLLDGKFRG